MSRAVRTLVGIATLLAVFGLGGCRDGGGDEEMPEGSTELEQQRTDVRAAAADLVEQVARRLDGEVSGATGRYEGCTSRFPEGYQDVRYLAQARVDVGDGAAEPYVDRLGPALEAARFTADEPVETDNGFVTVSGAGDSLETTVSWTGVGPFVLVRVLGPCVEVGEDEWSDWTGRTADTSLR